MKKFFLTALLCLTLSASFISCNTESDKKTQDTKTKATQTSKAKQSEEYISLDNMKAVPQFKLKDINGKYVSNEIFKDKKYTLITFWGTW